MGTARSKIAQLTAGGPRQAALLVYRKAVYRKVVMGRWGAPAGDHVAPSRPLDLRIDILGPGAYERVLGTSPHLTPEDVASFRRQRSVCIVVTDADAIVASSWMTGGAVWVHELQRNVEVPDGEHFSCRSWVDPDHRGRSLLSHMINHYATTVNPADLIWGLVYDWNIASSRSLERIGWTLSGSEWSTYVFGIQRTGSSRTEPGPGSVQPDTSR